MARKLRLEKRLTITTERLVVKLLKWPDQDFFRIERPVKETEDRSHAMPRDPRQISPFLE
jgi:hypothetical protein